MFEAPFGGSANEQCLLSHQNNNERPHCFTAKLLASSLDVIMVIRSGISGSLAIPFREVVVSQQHMSADSINEVLRPSL
jgi:hypothetical protein